MKKLQSILVDYISNLPELSIPAQLGDKPSNQDEKDEYLKKVFQFNKGLERKLLDRRIENRTILIIAIICLLVLVLIALLVGIFAISSGEIFGISLTLITTFFPLVMNIKWLRNRQKEDTTLLVLLKVLEGMKPEDAANFIDVLLRSGILKR